MRDIKFRAWDLENKKMIYDGIVVDMSDCSRHATKFNAFSNRESVPELIKLMQFTGLHDNSGREIYEGDILEAPAQEDILYEDQGNYLVKWNDDEASMMCYRAASDGKILASFGLSLDEIESLKLKVIGNICENPELLKQ